MRRISNALERYPSVALRYGYRSTHLEGFLSNIRPGISNLPQRSRVTTIRSKVIRSNSKPN